METSRDIEKIKEWIIEVKSHCEEIEDFFLTLTKELRGMQEENRALRDHVEEIEDRLDQYEK